MHKSTPVVDHYGTLDLTKRVEEALRSAGLDAAMIPLEALAPLDQFHLRGLEATGELASRLGIRATDRVLDVGCGIGGPARYVAARFGCFVTGIDLNKPFVDLANFLTRKTGLSDRLQFHHGDALHLPFDEKSMDIAITQHVAMNISDRDRLYAGICRVLKPGGRLAIYDVIAGDAGPLRFPVPWAKMAEHSYVVSEKEMVRALEQAGLAVTDRVDQTEIAIQWADKAGAAQAGAMGKSPLGLAALMGPEFPIAVEKSRA